MGTKSILEQRHDLALSVITDIEWEVYPVDHDDYGDTEWKWCVVFHIMLDDTWYELGSDYYRKQPDDTQIYNNLLEMVKDGSMGDYLADILTQNDNRKENKMKYDYENDNKAFNSATLEFFYDEYFKGEEGHDYTDEQITMSVCKYDIDDCLDIMRDILYKHFGIKEGEK